MANVTAREQLMLELINAARLDPLAEAARLGIDLNQGLEAGTLNGTPKQVLAMNNLLVAAARAHSQWMLDTDTFSHTGANGSTATQRITAAGYQLTGSWSTGENISVRMALPTINLDTAIVQQHSDLFLSPGHRTNILSGDFREIGVGQLPGEFLQNGTNWQASMVTQKFARSGTDGFVTGVVFNDTAVADGRYSLGEGIGGIGVSASGRSTATGSAGGYELALAAGVHTVGIGGAQVSLTLGASNVKLDLVDGNHVRSNASLTIQSGVGQATLIGIEAADLTGSAAAERLAGNAAANRLSGGAGNDTLAGGAGYDTLDGGDGIDLADYSAETLTVAVNLLIGVAAEAAGSFDTLIGIENVQGGSGNDFLLGNDLANLLMGGAGSDNVWGFGGNDTLFGGAGDDIVVGGDGNDVLHGGEGTDWLYGQDGADTIFATSSPAGGYSVLVGGDGNDTLEGGSSGFDYFYGGDGATGGGNDTFVVRAGSGIKVMNDFELGGPNDVVRLTGTALTSFAQVQANLSFSGAINGTVLVVDAGTQVWFLNGTQPAQLTAADFQFA